MSGGSLNGKFLSSMLHFLPLIYPIFTCLDPDSYSDYGSIKVLNTAPILIWTLFLSKLIEAANEVTRIRLPETPRCISILPLWVRQHCVALWKVT